MKNLYFAILKAKKVITTLQDALFEDYNEIVFQEDNEIALDLITSKEKQLGEELKTLNLKLKEIRDLTSEEELKSWAKEWYDQKKKEEETKASA